MRIIAGSLKGRRLNPPTTLPVRPTTDMARESLFNILNNYVDYEDCTVLDLFAGTGSITLELLSRGCSRVISIEKDTLHCRFIQGCRQSLCQPLNLSGSSRKYLCETEKISAREIRRHNLKTAPIC